MTPKEVDQVFHRVSPLLDSSLQMRAYVSELPHLGMVKRQLEAIVRGAESGSTGFHSPRFSSVWGSKHVHQTDRTYKTCVAPKHAPNVTLTFGDLRDRVFAMPHCQRPWRGV